MQKSILVKTVMRLKNKSTASFTGRGKPMLLQHNKVRPHINAAASAVTAMDLKLFYTSLWPGFGTVTSGFRNSQETSHRNYFTHNKEVQADTGKLFRGQPEEFYSDGFENFFECITSKEWETTWKNDVYYKVHTMSSFLVFFNFNILSGSTETNLEGIFSYTLHTSCSVASNQLNCHI
jgi:hypothetical protein